jgi:hypothetical protein
MHLEEKNEVRNKGQKSTTALHSKLTISNRDVAKKSFVNTSKTALKECVASLPSQIDLPTTWARLLERENSGFSV